MRSVFIIILFVQIIAAISHGQYIQKAPRNAHATVYIMTLILKTIVPDHSSNDPIK
jgi:hypothetical protein